MSFPPAESALSLPGSRPLAKPSGYHRTTPAYDDAVGWPFFRRVVTRFGRLVRRHRIRFRHAADVGCGTGLFVRYLRCAWGVPVIGVDPSAAMLAEARRRCAGLGVKFLRQDVRCLALPEPVDLITAHFDTLNHVIGPGDLSQAMRRIASNLMPDGWVYFDLVTPCAPLGGFNTVLRRMLTVRSDAAPRLFEQRAVWLPGPRLIAVRARAVEGGPCGIVRTEDRHFERAYGAGEIDRAMAAAGLVVRGVYDEATLRFPGRCPPRLIVVAQKPA